MRVLLSSRAQFQVPEEFDYLPRSWWLAVATPLHMAYPDATIICDLVVGRSQPLPDVEHDLPVAASGAITVVGAQTMLRRRIVVPTPQVLHGEESFSFVGSTDPVRALVGASYRRAYEHAPLALDTWRQWRNTRKQQREVQIARWPHLAGPELPPRGGRPAVWLAMHWLEAGGAESWALDSARLAQAAGFEVIITADRPAPQSLLEELLELTPHVYLGAHSLAARDWLGFTRSISTRHNLVLLHIHHSARAYELTPWLKLNYPQLQIVDSTHVIEHRTGGFVAHSIAASDLIDLHHVISPQLRDHYQLGAGIAAEKVAYWPLTHHFAGEMAAVAGQESEAGPGGVSSAEFSRVPSLGRGREPGRELHHKPRRAQPRDPGPLRIGFLGRFAPQKRPLLFVELAARLHRLAPQSFSFMMQGDGVLAAMVRRRAEKLGMEQWLQMRPWGDSAQFLAEIDVLVISSENEGLTLTTLEASRQGVLVVSTDVGSQATVVAPGALLPLDPGDFLRSGAELIAGIARDRARYDHYLSQQILLAQQLLAVPGAAEQWAQYLSTLQEQSCVLQAS